MIEELKVSVRRYMRLTIGYVAFLSLLCMLGAFTAGDVLGGLIGWHIGSVIGIGLNLFFAHRLERKS